MKIPDSKIEEIKNSVFIEEIVGEYVSLTRKGDRLWGLCPFHSEKTASFTVTPDKGLFYCFGCGKGGTVFTFLQEIENCTFTESLEILAKKGGVDLVFENTKEASERKKKIELHTRVANSFHYILDAKQEAEDARRYLFSRNVSKTTIDGFSIGWAPSDPSWLWKFLKSKHYSDDFLEKSGLFSKRKKKYPLFTGRVMFPIYSVRGDIIGFGGRTLEKGRNPKYINSPESDIFKKGNNLFGMNAALKAVKTEGRCILVEGYTDVIALHQAGFTEAVAPLGTALTEKQAELLKRYAQKAVIMFDGDDAGLQATKKALLLFESIGMEAEVVRLKEGTDPAEILQENGVQTLKNLLDYSINAFEYIMEASFLRHRVESPAGKEAACWDVFAYLDKVQGEIKREEYLKKLAEKSQIDITSIWAEYQNRKKTSDKGKYAEKSVRQRNFLPTDLYLMIAVAVNVNYFSSVRNALDAKDMETPEAKEIYISLEENFRLDTLDTQAVIRTVERENIRSLITESVAKGEFSGNIDTIVRDSIRQIKRKGLISRQKYIIEQIKKAEKRDTAKDIKELLEEKIFIDDELNKLRLEGNVESAN